MDIMMPELDGIRATAKLREGSNDPIILLTAKREDNDKNLGLNIGDYAVRKIGSQGQKKTFLIALKLAQYHWLHQMSEVKPLLLLDDIFDKLDADRVEQIVKIVGGEMFGQVFITDTNRGHIDDILRAQAVDYKLFTVTGGEIS